ncbi:MAG: aquaporin [Planctomycetaceae bacterium]|nr:aquaporin [Planctomycetaceae bacterium]
MQKLIVEFIGTFFLVLTIGCAVLTPTKEGGAGNMAPLAIGSALMVMIFAGGHISGAHYNPAVTLAVWLRGKCTVVELLGYIPAQVGGALLAALMVQQLINVGPRAPQELEVSRALIAEFLFTFALCYVVLNVATAKGTSGNSFYGLAIGFTVLTGAYAVGPISGGAFNPAVAVGITVLGMSSAANIWIFLLANFAAAVAAAGIFKMLNPDDN